MTTFRNTIKSSLLTLAVVGLGLASTPDIARADVLDFQVDESAVPGTLATPIFVVDGLTGAYAERIDLTPTGIGTGTFEASLYVIWAAYTQDGGNVDSQIGATGGPATDYGLYALVTATGTYTNPLPGTFFFEPETATAAVWVDPDLNTTFTLPAAGSGGDPVGVAGAGEDFDILTGTQIDEALSFGVLVNDLTGSYTLVFTDPTLTNPEGMAYWPDLPLFNLTAIADGNFDQEGDDGLDADVTDGLLGGNAGLAFQVVPEPATLTLLGLGLLGVGTAARRRRA